MSTRAEGLPWVAAIVTVASVLAFTWSPVVGQSLTSRGTRAARSYRLNPDPPCFDNVNRYVNCGNGTVTDTHTGVIWLQDAGCLGSLNWADANRAATELQNGECGLTDGSKPGDWRLPSNAEWMAMVDAAKNHPLLQCTNPALTDDSGSVCFGDGSGSSFANVTSGGFWTSTTHSQSGGLLPDATKAGQIFLGNGIVATFFDKSCCPQLVWPVRAR
jgi:hypothetical protein